MKNKILIYGDSNLNIIDGSSVWVVNLAILLAKDPNNVVDVLLKTQIKNDILVKQLEKYSNICLLDSKSYLKKIDEVDYRNFPKILRKIDSLRDYSLFIVRGRMVVNSLISTNFKERMIPYITDFSHNEKEISNSEKEELLNIYNNVNNMFVQTIEMKEYLERILDIDGKKFSILSPVVFELPEVLKMGKTIVYAGKLAKKWYIEELLEIMDRLYKIDPQIKLIFVGNKFNSDLVSEKTKIISKLCNSPNIEYIEQLSKEDTCNLINRCMLGFGFRSEEIDNDNSLEISIKFLEYSSFRVPTLLRRTRMYERILGKDYPLFVESVDDAVLKIVEYFNNDNSKIIHMLKEKFKEYTIDNIYSNIKAALYSYEQKKLRLLVSGHDLKFFKPLLGLLKKDYEVVVQELKDYRNLNKKESLKLLLNCDIVWCEWMLLNAAYYSKHVYSHQKLFIRAHRFEIEKNYGFLIDYSKVSSVIAVSYYFYEQFLSKFKIPRSKITVVNNFIQTSNYNLKKTDGYQYNLALIGAVPSLKGLDKAIDILIKLNKINDKYKLFVVGKLPEEWPNAWNIKSEREYFQRLYKLIEDKKIKDRVIFTGWIQVSEFLKNIGFVLSTSTVESFHLAPLEGMVSGSLGLALSWPGIEYVFPNDSIYDNVNDLVNDILRYSNNDKIFKEKSQLYKKFVCKKYDIEVIYDKIKRVLG